MKFLNLLTILGLGLAGGSFAFSQANALIRNPTHEKWYLVPMEGHLDGTSRRLGPTGRLLGRQRPLAAGQARSIPPGQTLSLDWSDPGDERREAVFELLDARGDNTQGLRLQVVWERTGAATETAVDLTFRFPGLLQNPREVGVCENATVTLARDPLGALTGFLEGKNLRNWAQGSPLRGAGSASPGGAGPAAGSPLIRFPVGPSLRPAAGAGFQSPGAEERKAPQASGSARRSPLPSGTGSYTLRTLYDEDGRECVLLENCSQQAWVLKSFHPGGAIPGLHILEEEGGRAAYRTDVLATGDAVVLPAGSALVLYLEDRSTDGPGFALVRMAADRRLDFATEMPWYPLCEGVLRVIAEPGAGAGRNLEDYDRLERNQRTMLRREHGITRIVDPAGELDSDRVPDPDFLLRVRDRVVLQDAPLDLEAGFKVGPLPDAERWWPTTPEKPGAGAPPQTGVSPQAASPAFLPGSPASPLSPLQGLLPDGEVRFRETAPDVAPQAPG